MGLKKSTLLLQCILPNVWIRYKYCLHFYKNIQILGNVHVCVRVCSCENTKASGGKHQFRVRGMRCVDNRWLCGLLTCSHTCGVRMGTPHTSLQWTCIPVLLNWKRQWIEKKKRKKKQKKAAREGKLKWGPQDNRITQP